MKKSLNRHKISIRTFALIFTLLFWCNSITMLAADIKEDSSFATTPIDREDVKITSELQSKMNTSGQEDIIPVCIFLYSVDKDIIDQKVLEETKKDPKVFENAEEFDQQIVPHITEKIELEEGYKKAHQKTLQLESVQKDVSNTNMANAMATPIEVAISEICDDYLEAKRDIVKEVYSSLNQNFITQNNINIDDGRIIHKSKYAPFLIVKATKEEISNYANSEMVESISFFEDMVMKPTVEIALDQVGVYCEGGTGTTITGGWLAYDGYGVKIGVIEAEGAKLDSSHPQLVGNNRIQYIENYKSDGTKVESHIDNHATKVTNIIAGRTVIVKSVAYSSVVPFATVYQTPMITNSDLLNGIEMLIEKGVNIINLSLGGDNSGEYSSIEKAIDNILANTNVVLVVAAGNEGNKTGIVTSPGLVYNGITVGNAMTKDLNIGPLDDPFKAPDELYPPFDMSNSSGYIEEKFLTNKPDISAPGVLISDIGNFNGVNLVSQGSGTSFATPIVTGIVAQMMQANSSLKNDPNTLKAALLQGAENSKITSNNNSVINSYMKDRSGVGFVNAIHAVTNAFGATKINLGTASDTTTNQYYIEAGKKIRAVMTFTKENKLIPGSIDDTDDIDFKLKNVQNGKEVGVARSSYNNVEIIEYTVPTSGYYEFATTVYRLADPNNPPEVSIVFTAK